MKYLLSIILGLVCSISLGNEWMSARPIVPAVQNVTPYQFGPVYYYAQLTVMVPVVPQFNYVPVVSYGHMVVEKNHWCLLKKYEIIPVMNTVYVPTFPPRLY